VRRRPARGAETLERGGDSPEGLGPSNKAEVCSRGAMTSSGVGVLQCDARPSSEKEVHSRVAGMVVWWATDAIGSWALFVFGL
jgi:hypothetical protein